MSLLAAATLDAVERLLNPPTTKFSFTKIGGTGTDAYTYFNSMRMGGGARYTTYSADKSRLYIGADQNTGANKTSASLRLSDMAITIEDSAARAFSTIVEDSSGAAWGICTAASPGLYVRTAVGTPGGSASAWALRVADTGTSGIFARSASGLYYRKSDDTWYSLAGGTATVLGSAPTPVDYYSSDPLGDLAFASLAYGSNLQTSSGTLLLTPAQAPILGTPTELGGLAWLESYCTSLRINATYSLLYCATGYPPLRNTMQAWLVNKSTPAIAPIPNFALPVVPAGSTAQVAPLAIYATAPTNGTLSVWWAGNQIYSATVEQQRGGILRTDIAVPNI